MQQTGSLYFKILLSINYAQYKNEKSLKCAEMNHQKLFMKIKKNEENNAETSAKGLKNYKKYENEF